MAMMKISASFPHGMDNPVKVYSFLCLDQGSFVTVHAGTAYRHLFPRQEQIFFMHK